MVDGTDLTPFIEVILVVIGVIAVIVYFVFRGKSAMAWKRAMEAKPSIEHGTPRGGNRKLGKAQPYEPVTEGGEELMKKPGLYPKSRNGQATGSGGSIKDVKDPLNHKTEE